MADNINYKECFLKCAVVNKDDTIILDLPFPIYHQTIIYNGVNHYCNIPNNLVGKEVLAMIHYAIKDEETVKSFKGYIGEDWKAISKDSFVAKNWAKNKEEILAINTIDKDGKETIIKYNGIDKADIVHPYYMR